MNRSIFCLAPVLVILHVLSITKAEYVSRHGIAARRVRRDQMSDMITNLARNFITSGGQQGVNDLNNNDDKMSVLKRYLGSAVMSAVLGGGSSNSGSSGGGGSSDLISRIMSMVSGGGGSSSRSGTGTGSGSGSGSSGSGGTLSTILGMLTSGGKGGSRTGAGATQRDRDLTPISTNSKTGMSVINSRPSDRVPSSSNNAQGISGRGRSSSTADDEDYIAPSSSRSNSQDAGRNGVRDYNADNDYSSNSRGNYDSGRGGSQYGSTGGGRNSGGGRDSSEIYNGSRSANRGNARPAPSDSDY